MLLEPLDPNERFHARRRQARRRRTIRRVGALAVVALSAAAIALGASFIQRGSGNTSTSSDVPRSTGSDAPAPPPKPEPRPLPAEIRGVHVTMALASLDGKLEEYYDLSGEGLNTIQLDVKDENGEVAFNRPRVPLAERVGASRNYYDPRRVARDVRKRGLYLIGRIVVFQDPFLAEERPALAIRREGGGVWTTAAGLAWSNPYDERVWKYNLDVAEAAVEAGFDEIMFDYVRFPTDGDVSTVVYEGRRREHRSATISRFLDYARGRLEPLGARVSAAVFGLSATREMGIGQRPRRLARYLDAIYPMVYPSHYGAGEFSLDDPNAVPGITVARSLRDFRRALRGRDTLLVPWLQDFTLGREYALEDVRAQVRAARDLGSKGFLLWNAAGVYTPGSLAGT
ncbi:MAG: putative glycoside hydrolase [Gaiellaceae bacterium]